MFEKLDIVALAITGFFITFINVMGKIVSADLYPEKTMKAKIFISSSKAILGCILVLVIVKGVPYQYPLLKDSEFLIYFAWLVAYFAVDLMPIAIMYIKNKLGVKDV